MWAEVDGERLFFCCDLCLVQYRELIDHIKHDSGWDRIDSLDIAGDRRGRTCDVGSGENHLRYRLAFNTEGRILRFQREDLSTAPT